MASPNYPSRSPLWQQATEILVPLDGSSGALWALPYAEELARVTGSRLRLLSVIEREPRGLTARSERTATAIEQTGHDAATRYLAGQAASLQARHCPVDTAVTVGDPVDAILEAGDEPATWAVVMATRGQGAVDRWVVGSVADKVMRLGTRPTLLIRPPRTSIAPQPVTFRRLLVPLDGSPLAEAAVPLAVDLATATGSELMLVHVVRWMSTEELAGSVFAPRPVCAEDLDGAAETYLRQVRSSLPETLPVETAVFHGDAARALTDVVMHRHIDLTLMTTHGRGGLSRMVIGSTADRLVRTGIATMLIRPNATPAG